MTKQCLEAYEKFLLDNKVIEQKLSADQRTKLQNEYERTRKVAEDKNLDLTSTEGDKTVADKIIEDKFKVERKQKIIEKLTNITSLGKAGHFKRDYATRVKFFIDQGHSQQKAEINALQSLIWDTNDVRGGSPLLEIFKSKQIELQGELTALTLKHFGVTFDRFFINRNKQNREDFIRELIHIEQTKNTKGESVTGNTKAQAVARGYFKIKVKKMANRILTGDDGSISNVNQRIVWDKKLVGKLTKEQFVQKHFNDLNEAVHGTRDIDKKRVLEETYDQITLGDGDWRKVGDKIQAGNKKSLRKKTPIIQFKDGEAFLRVHEEYSRVGIEQQIITDIREFARQDAIQNFFGPNINPIRNFLTREGNRLNSHQVDGSLIAMDQMLSPNKYENNNTYAAFQSAKNLQVASKLGTATFTAMIDVPTAILAGKSIFGIPYHQTVKLLTAGVKLSAKEERLWAQEMGFIFDDMIGRFGEEIGGGATFGGWTTKKINTASQVLLKASYLQQWTNNLRGAVAGLYSRQIGKAIKNKTPFNKLNKGMQEALAKYGIDDVSRGGESAWSRLLNNDVLDARGFIDMRKLGDLDRVFENAFGKTSLSTNLTTLFNDVSRTLVIEGNDFDKSAARFFGDNRKVFGAAVDALMQFKQIPVGIFRKIILRHWKNNSAANTIAFASGMFVITTLMGAIVNDLKDYSKGRQVRKVNSLDKWTRAAITGGGLGIVSDVFMEMGGEDFINAVFKGEKPNVRLSSEWSNLLGPVFGDGMKLMEGIIKLGASPFVDDKDYAKLQLRNLTQTGLGLVPLQNLWWAQMVFRKYIHEFLLEAIDGKTYRLKERTAERRAREERKNGDLNNFLYEKVLP